MYKHCKVLKIFTITLTAFILSGCAGASKKEVDVLRGEVAQLKTTLGDVNWKLEELSNKLMLLQEQIITDRIDIPAESAQSNDPPEDLKVVRLSKKREKNKKEEKPEIYITKSKPATGPDALYREGQDLFLSGNYKEARKRFSEIAEKHPNHDLADNALYWGAESYYSVEEYDKALKIFRTIVDRYSNQNKAPDALLKVAYSNIELGRTEEGKNALRELLEKYPDTNAALKAKKRLESL